MDSEIFEKLPATKLFFRCAIPYMITMAFGALYQIADGLFVGRFIGGDALAAVNLIMPIIMIVFGFANLIATCASVRISVLLGAVYLNKGIYNGRRILSERWINLVAKKGFFPSYTQYGYCHAGMRGQMLAVFPKHKLTVAWHGFHEDGQEIKCWIESFLSDNCK